MALKTITINSIFRGQSAAQYFGSEDTFNTSIAIDPDLPILSTDVRTSGFPVPVGYADFSGVNVNATVVNLINNPKNELTYTVLANGRLISYSSTFGSETLIASTFTVTIASPAVFTLTAHGLSENDVVYFSTSGALPTGLTAGTAYYVIAAGITADAFEVSATAGGAAINTSGTQSGTHKVTRKCSSGVYYNNYIYLFGQTNISRYGPLDGTPALTHGFWITTLSKTTLTDTTYPTLRGISIPNHVGHVHGDNSMYFTDFINGQGLIHRINTKKSTYEGEVNGTTVASAYNALDLPFGFYPTDVESFGNAVMISGIYSTSKTINQGKSAFVLWNPTDQVTFYLGPVFLPDPLTTALLNVNGTVYIFSGNGANGVRLSRYNGGESVSDVTYQEEGMPPFAGAVDALGNRIVWGGYSTNPSAGAVAWAYGSKDVRIPEGLHSIAKFASAGANPMVTALKYIQQDSNETPRVIGAWKDDSDQGIDKHSATATLASKIRWMINIGEEFDIRQIKIPLAGAVAANTTITPKLYFDDLSTNKTLTVINNTNYSGKRKIIYSGTELKDTRAYNNVILELAWTGTNPLPVGLPITLIIDEKED